jgi:hypothetical protein
LLWVFEVLVEIWRSIIFRETGGLGFWNLDQPVGLTGFGRPVDQFQSSGCLDDFGWMVGKFQLIGWPSREGWTILLGSVSLRYVC